MLKESVLMRSGFAIIFAVCISSNAQAQFGEYPERPVYDMPKNFSEEGYKRVPPVMPPLAVQSGHCKFAVKVGQDGNSETVDIKSCTDSIFKQETLNSANLWQYSKNLAGEIIEQNMTFRLTDESGEIIPEAEPAKIFADDLPKEAKAAALVHAMYPAKYPWYRLGVKQGYCCVDFSVSQIGTPFNVDVRGCTDPKFKVTAEEAIRWRKYTPAKLNGKDVSVAGHQTSLDFYKLTTAHDIPRDIFGNIPVSNMEDTKLGVCRPNS